MLVADIPPVPVQETPIVWVQTVPRSGEDGARLDGVRNEATCGAMPVGYCALRGLQELITDFDVQSGEIDMLFMDAIDDLPHQSPPVLVAAATTSVAASLPGMLYGTIGVCYPASNVKGLSIFAPAIAAEGVFAAKEYPLYVQNYAEFAKYSEQTTLVEVLQQPRHGKMVVIRSDEPDYIGPNVYRYTPNIGYSGNDKAEILVTLGEHKVKVIYFIKVIDTAITTQNREAIYRKYCPQPSEWLISSEQGGSPLLSQFLDFSGLLG